MARRSFCGFRDRLGWRTSWASCGLRGPRAGRVDCDERVRRESPRVTVAPQAPLARSDGAELFAVSRHRRWRGRRLRREHRSHRSQRYAGGGYDRGCCARCSGAGTSAGTGAGTAHRAGTSRAPRAPGPGPGTRHGNSRDRWHLARHVGGAAALRRRAIWRARQRCGPDLSGDRGSTGTGTTLTGTSGGSTAGFGGGGGPSSGSLEFSGGGGTPSAGLGVPTTTQLPSGAWTKWAVSLVGIMPCLRAASASAGADSAPRTSRSSASFCCCNIRVRSRAWLSWYERSAASVDNHSVRASPTASEPMTSTTNGTLLAKVRGRRSIDASRAAKRSVNLGRTTLGALAFRALARALAWLVFLGGPAGRRAGDRAGLRSGRPEPHGWARWSCRARVRRDDAESAVVRLLVRAEPSPPLRRSLLRRFGASRLAFMNRPSRLRAAVPRRAQSLQGPQSHCGAARVAFHLGRICAFGAVRQ